MNSLGKLHAHIPTRLLLLGLALLGQNAGAQSLVANGSFEEGGLPTGWRARAGGSVTMGDAHRGLRSVGGEANHRSVVWESDSSALSPQTDYRLEGWIRCPAGEGRLDMELTDATGKVLQRIATPTIRRAANWQYAAVEWNAAEATLARAMFSVQGKADLDDVVLAPVAASFIGNKSAEGDGRGRISMWSEEQNNELLPGRRAGRLTLDSEVKRSGKTSVRLVPEGDWFALASVNYPVAPWTGRVELSGWARTEGPASAQILACWTDDAQKVLRRALASR